MPRPWQLCAVLSRSIRLDDDLLKRLDRVAAALETKVLGVKVSRADVIRSAVERGLVSFEAEHQLPSLAAE